MKTVPFVANSGDDMHCVQAVFRMIHQHFFHTDLSWPEIDRIMHAIPGKGTWTFPGEAAFAKKGLKVRNIEPVDYERLHKEGISYLSSTVGRDTATWYGTQSNIGSVLRFISEYLSRVRHETRRASTDELIGFLREDALVAAEVNAAILNKTQNFSLHQVLLYDADENSFFVHDPGLPPGEARKVPFSEFELSFNFPGANGGITVFQTP